MTKKQKKARAIPARPIDLLPEEVRAVRSKQKTQLRRLMDPQPTCKVERGVSLWAYPGVTGAFSEQILGRCLIKAGVKPYARPGDRLWVREPWAHDADSLAALRREVDRAQGPYYRADVVHEDSGLSWLLPAKMPRWVSRLMLEVMDVRAEPLPSITEIDAKAECPRPAFIKMNGRENYGPNRVLFSLAWDAYYGEVAPWDSNPWVWALTFEEVTA